MSRTGNSIDSAGFLNPCPTGTTASEKSETGRRDTVEDLGIFSHIAGIQTSEQDASWEWKLEDLHTARP